MRIGEFLSAARGKYLGSWCCASEYAIDLFIDRFSAGMDTALGAGWRQDLITPNLALILYGRMKEVLGSIAWEMRAYDDRPDELWDDVVWTEVTELSKALQSLLLALHRQTYPDPEITPSECFYRNDAALAIA